MSQHEKDNYTWVQKRILYATCSPTLVDRRCSTCPFMTLVTGGAQRGVRPWQCIPLPCGKDCARTIFVSSMFTFSVTETDSQPNVVSLYMNKCTELRKYAFPDPYLTFL